jgi:hypothetical protein
MDSRIVLEIRAPSDEFLARLLQVLDTIEYLGDVGASRELSVMVDGDGAARFSFKMWNEEKLQFKDLPKFEAKNIDDEPIKFDLG